MDQTLIINHRGLQSNDRADADGRARARRALRHRKVAGGVYDNSRFRAGGESSRGACPDVPRESCPGSVSEPKSKVGVLQQACIVALEAPYLFLEEFDTPLEKLVGIGSE